MPDALVSDVAEVVSTSAEPLAAAAGSVLRHLNVDRVSVVRFEDDCRAFRVLATAGAELCSVGTRLPVASSTHYVTNSEGRVFAARSLDQLDGFDRSSDQLILARGFRSSCSVPLVRGAQRVGALNLSTFREDVRLAAVADELAGLSGMLTLALAATPIRRGPRVLICHDDVLSAMGLARLCEQSGTDRVAVMGSIDEAVESVVDALPDMILCDNYLGGRRVDDVVATLRRAGAAAPVVVVASHDTAENANAAVRAGASAYITRGEAPECLGLSIATLRSGRTSLPPETNGADRDPLTSREVEVLSQMNAGLRVKQIARVLGISENTAKNHVRNIFRKLDATSRTEALHEARRQGMLS